MKKIKKTQKHNSLAYGNIHFLKLLANYRNNPSQFKKLINHCSKNELDAITEIVLNFLQGSLKCDTKKN